MRVFQEDWQTTDTSGCAFRTLRRRRMAEAAATGGGGANKATPKAMTPSAAYPYYEQKPMQFRGVKVRATPPVSFPPQPSCPHQLLGIALQPQSWPAPWHCPAPAVTNTTMHPDLRHRSQVALETNDMESCMLPGKCRLGVIIMSGEQPGAAYPPAYSPHPPETPPGAQQPRGAPDQAGPSTSAAGGRPAVRAAPATSQLPDTPEVPPPLGISTAQSQICIAFQSRCTV